MRFCFLIFINFQVMFLFNSCQSLFGPDNSKLVANAGPDQTTIVGSYAVFDPTYSKGDYNWYEWQQDETNPEEVKLFSQGKDTKDEWNIQKVGFVKEGIYKFRLIVRSNVIPGNMSGTSASEADEVVVTVNPNPYSHFEDPNLEIMVRITLNKQVDELTGSTLLGLDSLQFLVTPKLVSSLRGLESCKNLNYLHMGSQDISDISPLSSLIRLKELTLDQNYKISDVSPLANLTELEWLDLSNNKITDISALKKLVKLKYLNLQINPVNNIDVIQYMHDLKTLLLFKAILKDISALANLLELKRLWIVDSKITDISYIKNIVNIENLHLAWNQISDITPLSNMKKLEWLALEKNNISDISPLKDLPNLRYIRLWDNQIANIKPLVDNRGIGEGDIVGLDGNPLDEKSINEYIPALQARGVLVTW